MTDEQFAISRGGARARRGMSLLASRAILARSIRAVKKQIMMMKKRLPNASKNHNRAIGLAKEVKLKN